MPVDILYIDTDPAGLRPILTKAVTDAVGDLPGFWKAWITQSPDSQSFSIRIDGPEGCGFSYRFQKLHERQPEFVYRMIYDGVRRVSGLRAA
jgi:hypothetical protein